MKRIFIFTAALVIALAVVVISRLSLPESSHGLREPPTNGLLKLTFVARNEQNAQANKEQIAARALLFSLSPAIHDNGVQSDKMVHILNTGAKVITLNGYNSSSPWYAIQIKKRGDWAVMPMTFTTPVGQQQPRLKGGESLDFNIIVPDETDPWRVCLYYEELPVTKTPTLFDRYLRQYLRWFYRPSQPEPKPFFVYSEVLPR